MVDAAATGAQPDSRASTANSSTLYSEWHFESSRASLQGLCNLAVINDHPLFLPA